MESFDDARSKLQVGVEHITAMPTEQNVAAWGDIPLGAIESVLADAALRVAVVRETDLTSISTLALQSQSETDASCEQFHSVIGDSAAPAAIDLRSSASALKSAADINSTASDAADKALERLAHSIGSSLKALEEVRTVLGLGKSFAEVVRDEAKQAVIDATNLQRGL